MDLARIYGRHPISQQQLVGAVEGVVGVADENLVEFLTGAQTCEDDVGRTARVDLGGKTMRQVDDLDRRAHIKNQNVSVVTDGPGLEHELHGFWDRHEVTESPRDG